MSCGALLPSSLNPSPFLKDFTLIDTHSSPPRPESSADPRRTSHPSSSSAYDWQSTRVLSPEAERLVALQARVRWGIVGLVWLVVGVPSLWLVRADIRRLFEFFTWAAVKYPLIYQPIAGFGLCVCVAVTLTTLLWQSKFELFGPSARERRELEKLAASIRKQGSHHFLSSWVRGDRRSQ